jgi:predicted CoA-binding protein
MATMKEAAKEFLALDRIAVVGVSRAKNKAANLIYRKLRTEGYKVFAVNPNTKNVEGDICYPDLRAIPEKPGGVVIVTNPEITKRIVRECADLGIANVWMHNGIDSKGTSISPEGVEYCHNHNINVIPGGCPMMFCVHADTGHRVMRWVQTLTGKLPKKV